MATGAAPTPKDLSKQRYGLNTVDDKPNAGGVKEVDPDVKAHYEKVWDDNAGDKAKIVEALHLDGSEWTDGLDKAGFVKKFAGH